MSETPLASLPKPAPTEGHPLLEVRKLRKFFPTRAHTFGLRRQWVRAVDEVSFALERGKTLALVGESGCGKSTVGRSILRLVEPTGGEILLDGAHIEALSERRLRPLRRRMQVVFQDPFSSLNPRLTVYEILAEPIRNFGLAQGREAERARIARLLEAVRLPRDALSRRPHEFSGGQRQRIGIARALAPDPELLVCDEAVAALDVSVKAQILNLLADLQESLGLAVLFISHDLAVVEHLAHRIAVMYLGRIVEEAPNEALFAAPHHPYTRALLSAVPVPDPFAPRRRIVLKGDVPSPLHPPPGCHFHSRCPYAVARCREEVPKLRSVGPGHVSACHFDIPLAS